MSVLLAVVAVNCLCLDLGEPMMETWCWFWVISTTVDLGELNKSKLVIIMKISFEIFVPVSYIKQGQMQASNIPTLGSYLSIQSMYCVEG